MPIDPSVLLYGLQPQARTPYDAQDLVAERRAHVEQLREQAKAKQEAEYDNQVYDWAIKNNLGPDGTPDIPAVQKALYSVNARVGDKFAKAVTTARKATADTYDLEDKHRTNQVTLLGQSAANTDQTNYSDNFQHWKALGLQPEQFGLGPTWTPDTPMRLKAVGDAATTIPEQHKAKQDAIAHFVNGDFPKGAAQYVYTRGKNLTDGDVVDLTKTMTAFGASPEDIRTVQDQKLDELQAWAPGVIEGPAKVAELTAADEARKAAAARDAATAANQAAQLERQKARDAALAKNEAETRRLTERGQNLTNSRELQRLDLERKRLERENDHGKLSATAIEKLAGVETSLDTLDSLDIALNKGGMDKVIGPIQGRATAASLSMPGMTAKQDVAEFAADVATLKNSVIKAITGAQMSEPEANRIMTQVPDITNKPEVFRARMASTKRNLETLRRRTIELSGGTAPPVTPKAGGGTSTYTYDPATGTLKKSGG